MGVGLNKVGAETNKGRTDVGAAAGPGPTEAGLGTGVGTLPAGVTTTEVPGIVKETGPGGGAVAIAEW